MLIESEVKKTSFSPACAWFEIELAFEKETFKMDLVNYVTLTFFQYLLKPMCLQLHKLVPI